MLSLQVRTTRAGIVDYFTNFLTRSPRGRIDQSQIRMLSPHLALHSGVYSFTLEEEGKLSIVQVSPSGRGSRRRAEVAGVGNGMQQ